MREDIKREVRDLAFENAIAKASRPQKAEKPPPPPKERFPYRIVAVPEVVERLCGVAADVWVLSAVASATPELRDGNVVDAAAVKEWVRAAKKAQADLEAAIQFAIKACIHKAPSGTRISQARCTIGLLRTSSEIPF